MDKAVLNYIEKKFKPESLDPIFISDSEFNIPEKDLGLLNERLYYNLVDYDHNGTDLSHIYMQRVYRGNMHDSNSTVKYIRNLNVIVNTVKDISSDAPSYKINMLTERVYVPENRSSKKALGKKVSSMIRKFIRGDVLPKSINIISTYIDNLSIDYSIGKVHICSKYCKSLKSTEYFIVIPYMCNYVCAQY